MRPTDQFVNAIADEVERRLLPALAGAGAGGVRPRPRLLTVEAAGEYLSRSAESIRALVKSGRLPAVRIDARVFLDVHDLDRIIEASKGVDRP